LRALFPEPWDKILPTKPLEKPPESSNKTNLRAERRLLVVCDVSSSSHMSYRDKIYIIKDIILKLVEYGELNQTALVSFCGLNMTKHKPLIDDLEAKQLISKNLILVGKRAITVYKPSPKGLEFCKSILEPYEIMFPRLASIIR
jgi:predicted transcriptional regulator